MVNQAHPHQVLLQVWVDLVLGLLARIESPLGLAHHHVDAGVGPHLLGAELHDRREVTFVQLYDRLGPVDVQEVSLLQVPRVIVALRWLALLPVGVELPVYPDRGVVREDVEVLSELFQEATGFLDLVLGGPMQQLLLLDVGLDAVGATGCAVLGDDVDELVDFLAQAQHCQVADAVEEVEVVGPPLVALDFFRLH